MIIALIALGGAAGGVLSLRYLRIQRGLSEEVVKSYRTVYPASRRAAERGANGATGAPGSSTGYGATPAPADVGEHEHAKEHRPRHSRESSLRAMFDEEVEKERHRRVEKESDEDEQERR